jgi:hypothetical protein
MRFPQSNLLSDLVENSFKSFWRSPSLISEGAEAVTYGFRDFLIEEEYPVSRRLSTDYELSWDGFELWSLFFRRTWIVPVLVSLLYVLAIPIGKYVMRSRAPMRLKYALFFWNLGLALFSIIGTLRVLPSFIYGISINGVMYFICRDAAVSFGRGPIGFWSLLFVLSKYAELVDTVFLILRKKPVPFLHWYHHASVLLLSIGTTMIRGPTGIIMIVMNFFVHSIMYSYYAISAISRPPKWGKIVTLFQIAQMVGGLFMCALMYVGANTIENCEFQTANGQAISFIYASYLVLFVQFFMKRYTSEGAKKTA